MNIERAIKGYVLGELSNESLSDLIKIPESIDDMSRRHYRFKVLDSSLDCIKKGDYVLCDKNLCKKYKEGKYVFKSSAIIEAT